MESDDAGDELGNESSEPDDSFDPLNFADLSELDATLAAELEEMEQLEANLAAAADYETFATKPRFATSTRGRLLVATPAMSDSNFHRSVIYMLEHDEKGALGLAIDHASQMPVAESLPSWEDHISTPDRFFIGGPVAPEAVIALGHIDEMELLRDAEDLHENGFTSINAGIGTVNLHLDPEELALKFVGVRLFSGYCGWSPNQLEEEIKRGSWFVIDALADDLFTPEPETLWHRVLRRAPGRIRIFSNYPKYPSAN